MKIINLELDGLKLIELNRFYDNRGWFEETYNFENYRNNGITNVFVQDNRSFSEKKGVLRGMHFQVAPYSQAKLVRCTKGTIIDIVVDLRENSNSFLKWQAIELTSNRNEQLYIPRGFAHGFYCVSDDVIFEYKVDNVYCKNSERSVNYKDPHFNIDWDSILKGVNPILSEKDTNAPTFDKIECDF